MKIFKCSSFKTFLLVALTMMFFIHKGFAQQEDDVSFLIKAIKGSYIAYHEKTTDKIFDPFVNKTIEKHPGDTFCILSKIVGFFNDPHLAVIAYKNIPNDSVFYSNQLKEVKHYMSDPKVIKKKYEGYWINDDSNCVMALKMSTSKWWRYEGFVMQSDNLPPGLIMLKLGRVRAGKYETEYTNTVRGSRIYQKSEFRNDSVFTAGFYSKWRKIKNYMDTPLLPKIKVDQSRPWSRLIDSNYYLITLPGNTEENTRIMDSIVRADFNLIGATKNLIIDIRDNGGGTIRAYAPLTPFVYTNPIQQIGGYKHYSELICDVQANELATLKKEHPEDTGLVKLRTEQLEKCKMNVGKTLPDPGDVIRFDSEKRYPEHVAIIANYGCISAAEMMIFDYRQSKKVTVFGEHTYGAIDYLDNYIFDLPSKKYKVSVATAERKISKGDIKRDNIGVYPDVKISDSVVDWVEFVTSYYREKKKY